MANVGPDHLLITTHRRYEVTSGPKMLPDEVSLPVRVSPRYMYRALAFNVADYLGHCVLRRNRYHHVHMIRHQVTLFDPALLLLRQTLQYAPQIPTDLPKYRFLPVFRYENYVVLTLPTTVI